MRRLLAQRDARLLLVGQTLSFFGDRALYLVLGIWVKSLTGSNAAAGLLFFVLGVPALLAPLAGLLVDRMRRRPLMIAVDLAVGASVLLLLFVHGRDDVWIIYAVTFLYGVSALLFDSAMSALLTVLVPDDLLPEANAALQTSSEALRLIAPLAGAALFAAVGGGAVAVLDAATFLASAACLLLLAVKEPAPAPREAHFLAEASMGIWHVRRTPALRRIIGATGVTLLVVGFSETLGFAVVAALGHAPSFLGVILTIQGVGAIAGGLTAPRLVRRLGDGRVVGLGILVFAGASLLLTAPTLAIVAPGIVLFGLSISWVVVAFGTSIQQRTPANLQGRVYSAASLVVGVPQILSIAAGAALSTVVDYRILLVLMAVVSAGAGAYLFTRRFGPAAADVEAAESRVTTTGALPELVEGPVRVSLP
jgi:MFS family permease